MPSNSGVVRYRSPASGSMARITEPFSARFHAASSCPVAAGRCSPKLRVAAALLPLPGPLGGASFTVGASAPLFGLFGALVLYGQATGSRTLSRQVWQWVIIFVVIGLLIPFIDNWAHLGGFIGGFVASRWLVVARRR